MAPMNRDLRDIRHADRRPLFLRIQLPAYLLDEERPLLLILHVVLLEQRLDVLLILRRISRLGQQLIEPLHILEDRLRRRGRVEIKTFARRKRFSTLKVARRIILVV